MSFITLSSLSLFTSTYRKSLPSPLCGGMGVGFFWQSYKFSSYQRTIVAEFNDGESKLASF